MTPTAAPLLPWRRLAWSAALSTCVAVVLALAWASTAGGGVAALIIPGADGPSIAVVHHDFPEIEPAPGLGHDGQQFYAIARAPMHLDAVGTDLDRPRYRLQRPLLPWLAWLLHPQGGGTGLILALLAVNTAALVGGGLAMGALSVTFGGPSWAAAVFPLVIGNLVAVRMSVADTLALALMLGALCCSLRSRHGPAIALAVAAVLAKESMVLLGLGLLIARRDRHRVALVAAPIAVAGAWWLYLRFQVPVSGEQVGEFGRPFGGYTDAWLLWRAGDDRLAFATTMFALAVGLGALATRRGHVLRWCIALQLAFLPMLDVSVVGLDLNGTRMTAPLTCLGIVALLTPATATVAGEATAAVAAWGAEHVNDPHRQPA